MDGYAGYRDLKRNEREGIDYRIRFRHGSSGILVIAPHGGGIEPGSTEIADVLAGKEHSFYCFEGIKPRGNLDLHITSRRFDEPIAMKMTETAKTTLTVHGCRGVEPAIYLGGLDAKLKQSIRASLTSNPFLVQEHPAFPGTHPRNICNRNLTGKGVQFEIALGLRRMMFRDLSRVSRKHPSEIFDRFVTSVRSALIDPSTTQDHSGDSVC